MRYFIPSPALFLCSLTLLTGCCHMGGAYPGNYYGTPPYGYPGGYGGYGGQPIYQGTPIQTLTPGQQYYPGMIPQNSTPSTTPPTFQNNGGTSPLQPLDGGGTNAQPFNSSGGAQPVPDPYFGNPQSSYLPTQQPELNNSALQPAGHQAQALPSIDGVREVREDAISSADTFIADPIPAAPPRELPQTVPADPMMNNYFPAHQAEEARPATSSSWELEPAQAPSQLPEPQSAPAEMQFEAPIPASEFPEFNSPAEAPAETPAPRPAPAIPADADPFFGTFNSRRVSPFAHDAGYRWLKGVVAREDDGSWSIVYSDNPHPNDQLAGHVTLANSPLLKTLEDGDVVQVNGQVDPVAKDRVGKAVYLVTGIKKVSAGG